MNGASQPKSIDAIRSRSRSSAAPGPPGPVPNSACPTARVSAVVACSRVLPVSAIGPTGMLKVRTRGSSMARRERSIGRSESSGLQ